MMRYLLLALLVGVATAQHVAPCRCGAFVNAPSGEEIVYELPAIEVHSCDQDQVCQNRCHKEFDELSGGGDMNFITSDGETTVGQLLCQQLGHPIRDEFVYAYSEICHGPWEYTGGQSMQPLCCDEESNYFECHGGPPPSPATH